eukprot:6490277-Amphidinium_carterae.2
MDIVRKLPHTERVTGEYEPSSALVDTVVSQRSEGVVNQEGRLAQLLLRYTCPRIALQAVLRVSSAERCRNGWLVCMRDVDHGVACMAAHSQLIIQRPLPCPLTRRLSTFMGRVG